MWQDEASHLTLDQTNSIGEKKKGRKKKERENREERKRREKLKLLSTIYGDQWVEFRRAKN